MVISEERIATVIKARLQKEDAQGAKNVIMAPSSPRHCELSPPIADE